eukprot:TRINITY_DN809_c0_g1_i2.p8 TRINITY_DN809_c0_g1~~TRINITY_DN809_c0_g1_i2.p8  ORF type:complete len:129 (-),score=26.10 TRINITY_DN809_c0_g1_i2:2382-2768(-)
MVTGQHTSAARPPGLSPAHPLLASCRSSARLPSVSCVPSIRTAHFTVLSSPNQTIISCSAAICAVTAPASTTTGRAPSHSSAVAASTGSSCAPPLGYSAQASPCASPAPDARQQQAARCQIRLAMPLP